MGVRRRAKRQARALTVELALLDAMRPPGTRCYAYDLGRAIRSRPAPVFIALRKLEASGAVATGWERETIGRPPRRAYWLVGNAR